MSGSRPCVGRVSSAVIAALIVLVVCAPRAVGMPLIFNDALHQSGPRGTLYRATDLARAASDIAPGAILRFTVPWSGIQPYCLERPIQRLSIDGPLRWISTVPPVRAVSTVNRAMCQRPGPYDWNWNDMQSDLDSIAAYLRSGHVRLLPVVTSAPQWARGLNDRSDPHPQPGYDPQHPVMPPGEDPTALGWWRQFVAALLGRIAQRYGRTSLAGVEVWNEEDSYPFSWSLEPGPDATRYSKILCSASLGAWQSDPNLPVVFGGFSPTDSRYLRDAYSATKGKGAGRDIRTCMTTIGLHPYNVYNSQWVAPGTTGSPFATGASRVSQVADAARDAGRRIWITEFGYPVLDPPTGQQQAAWDARAYDLAPSQPNVEAMGIHTIFDQRSRGFQICAGPRSPLPAATELKRAVSGNSSVIASC